MTESEAKKRLAEIDAIFYAATHWGSWMIELANEREALAEKFGFAHKHLARAAGRKTH